MLCVVKGKSAFPVSNSTAKGESYTQVATHNWRKEGEVTRSSGKSTSAPQNGLLLRRGWAGWLFHAPLPFHPSPGVTSLSLGSVASVHFCFSYMGSAALVRGLSQIMPWQLQENYLFRPDPCFTSQVSTPAALTNRLRFQKPDTISKVQVPLLQVMTPKSGLFLSSDSTIFQPAGQEQRAGSWKIMWNSVPWILQMHRELGNIAFFEFKKERIIGHW